MQAPLEPTWTCANLRVGANPDSPGKFYPRCQLGDGRAREDWVAAVSADRMRRVQDLARLSAERLDPLMRRMWLAKARWLAARRGERGLMDEAGRELRHAAEEFLAAQEAVLDSQEAELESLGFPLEATKEITRAAVRAFVDRGLAESAWDPPPELLAPFPPLNRIFFSGILGSRRSDP